MKQTASLSAMIVFFMLFTGIAKAQEVKISGELRPRYEMRNGYKTLTPDNATAANFVSQRTRLNTLYRAQGYSLYLSIQDVRVWGDVAQLNFSDAFGPSVHEAWGQLNINPQWSVKAGRQEIVYDDHRIFGNVGWAQQARSHDAMLVKYKSGNHKIDVGLAYNANGESLFKENYVVNSYKTFQYLYYHGKFNQFGVSFLALNNGFAYLENPGTDNEKEKIAFSQTIGPRITYKTDGFGINAAFYFQQGKNAANRDLSAFYAALDVNTALSEKFTAGAGLEYLSGTDSKEMEKGGKDNSFTPFYGTNHKFNGLMDYFYVGNHGGNVGLLDIFAMLRYKKNKFSATLMPHFFNTAAKLAVKSDDGTWLEQSNALGTEVDLVVGYAISPEVNLSAGYSHLFATESMQVLKGGNYENTHHWAWVMITFSPVFYNTMK